MIRALTLGTLLCALSLVGCDKHPSSPPTPQIAQAAESARAASEFKCPAPSGRYLFDDGTNRGPNQPVRTNCTRAYVNCDAQSHGTLAHCPSGQVFDKRFSMCVVKDACDETGS